MGGGGSQEPPPPLGSGSGLNSAVGPLPHCETRTSPSLPKAAAEPLDLEVTQWQTPLLIPVRVTDPRAKDTPTPHQRGTGIRHGGFFLDPQFEGEIGTIFL